MADDSTKNYIPQIIPDPRKLQDEIEWLNRKLAAADETIVHYKRKRDKVKKYAKEQAAYAVQYREWWLKEQERTLVELRRAEDYLAVNQQAIARAEAAEARIARLIEAGDGLLESMAHGGYRIAIAAWQQAKDAD